MKQDLKQRPADDAVHLGVCKSNYFSSSLLAAFYQTKVIHVSSYMANKTCFVFNFSEVWVPASWWSSKSV